MVTAVPALESAKVRWPARQDRQLQSSAAAGRPRKTGTAAEVRGLDPATRSERERADRVTQRQVVIPAGAFEKEYRDEDRTGGLAAAQ
jgi:hypothetical protein